MVFETLFGVSYMALILLFFIKGRWYLVNLFYYLLLKAAGICIYVLYGYSWKYLTNTVYSSYDQTIALAHSLHHNIIDNFTVEVFSFIKQSPKYI